MADNNKNFNELLIEILKQIHIRLDRLDAKIDTKADKTDVDALRVSMEKDIGDLQVSMEKDIGAVREDVNTLRINVEKDIGALRVNVNSLGQRLDRIEAGIATLRWVIGAQVAIIGVILAIFKAF